MDIRMLPGFPKFRKVAILDDPDQIPKRMNKGWVIFTMIDANVLTDQGAATQTFFLAGKGPLEEIPQRSDVSDLEASVLSAPKQSAIDEDDELTEEELATMGAAIDELGITPSADDDIDDEDDDDED